MLTSLLICLAGGVAGGLLSGMLGIGGGILIVPLLIYLLPIMGMPTALVVPTAIGTSLATIMLTTLSGARAHAKRGYVQWSWVKLIAPAMVIGGFVGGALGARLPPDILQRIFAIVLLLLALQMIWKQRPQAQDRQHKPVVVRGLGVGIGAVAALVGIGGGALVVPLLHYYQVAMRNAVAIAAVCSVVLAAVGTFSYMVLAPTLKHADIPGLIGYVYLPAWFAIAATSVIFARVGAAIAHRLPVRYLQRAFAVLLVTVSLHLLLG